MKKWILLLLTMYLAVTVVVGCNSEVTKQEPKEVQEKSAQEADTKEVEEVTEEQQYPLTLTDALGNEVTIEAKPKRIVSLMPSVTETIYAVGAGENVVGRTDWCNFPAEVANVASVGQMEFDLEALIALEPDLVLAHEGGLTGAEDKLEQIRALGIAVVVVGNSDSFEGVYEAINLVSTATGNAEEGSTIVSNLKDTFKEISDKSAQIPTEEKLKVWVEIDPTLWTTGKGTFMHEILEVINVVNVAEAKEGWVQFTEEDVVAINPDVIVTTYGYYIENPKQQVLDRTAWSEVNAVKNQRIYDVDNDTLTRPGPRLAQGVEQLAKLIYPEIFN